MNAASRPPAIIAGLRAAELPALAAPPRRPSKLVTVQTLGRWWSIRVLCLCGCGHVARAGIGLTVAAAVARFRYARKEAWITEEREESLAAAEVLTR